MIHHLVKQPADSMGCDRTRLLHHTQIILSAGVRGWNGAFCRTVTAPATATRPYRWKQGRRHLMTRAHALRPDTVCKPSAMPSPCHRSSRQEVADVCNGELPALPVAEAEDTGSRARGSVAGPDHTAVLETVVRGEKLQGQGHLPDDGVLAWSRPKAPKRDRNQHGLRVQEIR